jgi:hypothetical protein
MLYLGHLGAWMLVLLTLMTLKYHETKTPQSIPIFNLWLTAAFLAFPTYLVHYVFFVRDICG